MQVPLIDRLNDLQAGLSTLQNPSFPSQITSTSIAGIQSVSIAYSFCKWGALILALVATVGGIFNRVTIFIIRFRNKAPSLPSISFSSDDDYTSSDNDDAISDLSSSSEFEDGHENELSVFSSFQRVNEYFRVRGANGNDVVDEDDVQNQNDNSWLKRRRSIGDIFSLSEIANSKSVVKLWDSIGFGLGLDFDDYEERLDGVVSGYDIHDEPSGSTAAASRSVVLSAGEGARGNLAVKIWDTRLRKRKPTVVAEWGRSVGKNVRVESGGVQKVYVTDEGRYGVTVGDMRKVLTPLGNVTESDADTWWDADAVIVSDEPYLGGDDHSMLRTS
ncbi:hypothetical protein HN51_009244 [Arachis hypogaea]|uniref:Uncharacterized protein n=2 Tax=Arachis TaxID=3817 RepID=A0A445D068_ARAHY|nr:uncharacterized protein LOC107472609 [Arachis duranensis]XP_025703203.1 uncharacterized protein LOC112803975 [Arachis hypogaea]XP_057761924.1 uncharacterized protein LOC130982085 [Arachis stenosperma]QHO43735.1 uncharacterized protein DS421_5g165170 [Arachis hypogaea]RYR56560.1 hypothetical protein Ahy_A05g022247 isoform B [Arachis hypogaea]